MFLAALRQKTFRGLQAAVLAGRFAGGRAYGYRYVLRADAAGRAVNGIMKVDERQAALVRRIFADFAGGQPALAIATALNAEKVPGPRGGSWNGSTIRGNPSQLVGILNNPLYAGRLVRGRREWGEGSGL